MIERGKEVEAGKSLHSCNQMEMVVQDIQGKKTVREVSDQERL